MSQHRDAARFLDADPPDVDALDASLANIEQRIERTADAGPGSQSR
ncbi:hypothetical protein [Halolamina litorea]|nr:hypothetical protein [Halolamina litorea]